MASLTWGLAVCAMVASSPLPGWAEDNGHPVEYRIKYVAEGVVYLEGGRDAGLKEGMKLSVKHPPLAGPGTQSNQGPARAPIAQIRVTSVAEVSTVCEIITGKEQITEGDLAYLEQADAEAALEQEAVSPTRRYPQVVTFTGGNPLDEEARASVPKPPSPEINRARGRIGFEYGGLASSGQASAFRSQLGLVMQSDITRIGGTYWNLSGYWHGLLNSHSGAAGVQTVTDLLNRTYHMSLTYSNPNSRWVAGFGRLYVPWAVSLDTIDGAYFGRRVGQNGTIGVFGGSTPDPTSWNYNPNRHIAGTFANFEGGSFDATHYCVTFGAGASSINSWKPDRPFAFSETTLSYKRYLTIYESLIADRPTIQMASGGATTSLTNTAGISRSFLTISLQPVSRFSIDANYNYFRDYPSFDLNLVSIGLVDKLLFQGLSIGTRFEITKRISFYDSFGRSSASGDPRKSWNQMYGVTLNPVRRTGIRADVRYSTFTSVYATGNYEALFLSRNFTDRLHWEANIGKQNLVSQFTHNTTFRDYGTMLDWTPGRRFFLDLNFNVQRGVTQSYNQWFITLGYRFDSHDRPRANVLDRTAAPALAASRKADQQEAGK